MAIVHGYLRREFALAPRIVADLRPGQDERRAAAGAWFESTLVAMHHHHHGEDTHLYPLLRGRVPDQVLDRMEEQHEVLLTAVAEVSATLIAWRDAPAGDDTAEQLIAAYDALQPVLELHLDDEEASLVPLIAAHLTAAEYGVAVKSGNGVFTPEVLMMAFGAMIEQCQPEDAEFMLSNLPPHVRQAWHESGSARYTALMALLRGDLTRPR